MALTPEEYYSVESNHGSYQYFTLKEIVDDLLIESEDNDSFLKNTKRSRLINLLKRGIRELSRDVANDVLAFEITVPDSLTFPLPHDYVHWVRVSVLVFDQSTKSYRLKPLDINYNIHTAVGYLQNHVGELLFDSNGQILESESLNALSRPYKSYKFDGSDKQFTTNAAKFSKYGEFVVDERRGFFLFGSELKDREVVIEYVSDGLSHNIGLGSVKVHKYLREALYDFVVKEVVSSRRNVSMADKRYLSDKWKGSRHRAIMARADFDLLRIKRSLLGKTKL